MSSPFKIFRKHQKVLLVVAGLMAMIAFVILPIVLQNFGLRQGGENPVVATTVKYGDLKQSDMQNLRARHECVLGVLASMASKLIPIGADEQYFHNSLQNILGDSKEQTLVNRWLMAKKAGEIGIHVSDATMTEFLTNGKTFLGLFMRNPQLAQLELGKLTEADFQNIFARYSVTQALFYDMLREELKVQEFQNAFVLSILGMPPGQRWDYYCRTQQRAKIECIPVPVEPFAAAFKNPGDKVLLDYFEKYKDGVHSPYSSEPGFRLPQKIEVEYFVADVDKFAAPENITEEEIQSYYQKDATNYDFENKKAILLQEEKLAIEKAEKEKAEKDKAEKEKATEKKPTDSGASPAVPATEKKEGDQTAPPSTDKPADESVDKPADKPVDKPAEKPADEPAEKAEGKSSAVERSPYRQVSYLAEEDKKPSEPPKADAPASAGETAAPKTDAPAGEPKSDEAKPAETKPAETKPAETKPSEAKTTEPNSTEAKPSEPVALPPTKDASAEEKAKDSKAEPAADQKRELTEEVRKTIRRRIAADKILAIYAKIEDLMKENAIEWKRYDAAKLHEEKDLKEPPKLDFASLAKQFGVTAGKTGEITKWDARDLEIGKSLLQVNQQQPPFHFAAFDNLPQLSQIGKYAPAKSQGENVLYLFWKTKDVKETAAKWEDPAVQKQVFEAWRLEQARVPALEKAKQLAEQAKKSKSTLKETFAGASGIEVLSPPLFAWMTGGNVPTNPQYQLNMDIEGVKMPGEEFMKTVFGLNEKGVGTSLNMPQRIAYVIQVEKFEPATDVLWNRFQGVDFNQYANAGEYDQRTAWVSLNKELVKEAGLQWVRKPDRPDKEDASGK